MYKRIIDYAKKNNLAIVENRKQTLLTAYINLDSDGNYKGLDVIERIKSKNKESSVDERVYSPDLGTLSKTAFQPNPIADKAEYILNKQSKKYPNWIEMMSSGKEKCNSLKTVWKFIEKYDTDEEFAKDVMQQFSDKGIKFTDFISFKIDSTPVESMEDDWNQWLVEYISILKNKNKKKTSDSDEIISSISGSYQKSCPAAACPEIKNIPSSSKAAFAIGACVYTASMKEQSYQSYGFEGAKGSQMGIEDATNFAAGCEHLLTSDKNHNNDFQLIYFYEDSNVEDIIGAALRKSNKTDVDELEEDDIENISAEIIHQESLVSRILNSVKKGEKLPPENKDIKFWMAHFNVPSKGRFYLSDEYEGSYGDLQTALTKWYEDTNLVTYGGKHQKPIIKTGALINFILKRTEDYSNPSTSSEKNDNSARYDKIKSSILKAMFENKPLPKIFYAKALKKATFSIIKSNKSDEPNKTESVPLNKMNKIDLLSLQIIKCHLIRNGVMLMPELTTNNSIAYNCGRLFATYERMQALYNKEENYKTTLTQTYFTGVLRHPNVFFVKLAKLSEVYRRGIEKPLMFEMLLGDLSKLIGNTIPNHFNDIEQGEFILGYYQQRADFISKFKKDDNITPNASTSNETTNN